MSQIRLAAMAVALSVAGFATTGLAQQAQRPQIETTKVDGTGNVYIFRNGNHQSMFIVTKDGVIATDPIAYGRPTGGQDYIAEIKKVTDKPIKFLNLQPPPLRSHRRRQAVQGRRRHHRRSSAGQGAPRRAQGSEHAAPRSGR